MDELPQLSTNIFICLFFFICLFNWDNNKQKVAANRFFSLDLYRSKFLAFKIGSTRYLIHSFGIPTVAACSCPVMLPAENPGVISLLH